MVKLVYVLLDGVGDLPHPVLNHLTPLEAAYTPNIDLLARNGAMGIVYSVGKGIAPESDIAVFNMLGYRFGEEGYVGRGVVEAIGAGMDFRDGDLAMRGNFATVDGGSSGRLTIVDRRVGRSLSTAEAKELADAVQEGVKLSKGSLLLVPTTGHRVLLRIRSGNALSAEISNTDAAYARVKGMGVAKAVGAKLRLEECRPLDRKDSFSVLAARLVNEFTKKSLKVLAKHRVNGYRKSAGKLQANCILLRDAGNRMPVLEPISRMQGMRFCCIVDMPVERGIAKVAEMPILEAGGILDYEQKARVAADSLREYDAVYVHIKGPDEFGHDGDARGKKRSIEEIDHRFFGPLLDSIGMTDSGGNGGNGGSGDVAVTISADHSTPCVKFGHSADPVPLLVSGRMIGDKKKDGLARFTESHATRGSLGVLEGHQVLGTARRVIGS